MVTKKTRETRVTKIQKVDNQSSLLLPLIAENLSAGFPSPALDFLDTYIDLNKLLVKRVSATYFGRVQGDSMKEAGIHDMDLIVIDRSVKPKSGKIAVCYLDGEFILKYLDIDKEHCMLVPANALYPTIKVTDQNDFFVWGIVTFVIKQFHS